MGQQSLEMNNQGSHTLAQTLHGRQTPSTALKVNVYLVGLRRADFEAALESAKLGTRIVSRDAPSPEGSCGLMKG